MTVSISSIVNKSDQKLPVVRFPWVKFFARVVLQTLQDLGGDVVGGAHGVGVGALAWNKKENDTGMILSILSMEMHDQKAEKIKTNSEMILC